MPKAANTLPAYRRKALGERRAALLEEYEAANAQLNRTLDDAERVRLRRQITDLERQIGEVEAEEGGVDVAPPLDLDSAECVAARARYLAALRERYNVIETHAFTALAEDEPVGPRRLALVGEGGVYVPLYFDPPAARLAGVEKMRGGEDEEDEREAHPLSLAEALQQPGHLAIIGDAGSGKTTVLHVLISALAGEDAQVMALDLAAALPGPRPLPVFLPLRLFEQACSDDERPGGYRRRTADLLRFVDDWFADWQPEAGLPPGFLAAHIRAGRAWFLLDALDEVADAVHRQTVRNVIQELAGQLDEGRGAPGGTRLVVTARVAAYRGARLDDRFGLLTVRDLDGEQRGRMVHAIYSGLALGEAEKRAADLAGRFEQSEALRELGRTPVMVWTATVIHALRGELPEGRAALYDAYVDILLKQSFKRTHFDIAAVDALAEGQGWPLEDRRHYLTYAAFQVHRLLEAQPERQAERRVVIGEDELADKVLAAYLGDNLGLPPREARRRAREFVGLMVERSGLVYETPQGYTISDRLTMQEFLAAYYLAENYALEDPAGYVAFMSEAVGRTWWREVILLAAGYLARKPGFQGRTFLQQVAGRDRQPEAQLASLALAARGLLQLRSQLRRPTWYTGLAQEFANRLYRWLYAEPAAAPAQVRQEAGLALGLLYGYPGREGGLSDPRFAHADGRRPDFVRIEGGAFWMGSSEEEVERLRQETGKDYWSRELPRHRVYLDPFELARFPTTNAMFARFVQAGGYEDERWWAEAIADKRWTDGRVRDYVGQRSQPALWDDSRFNSPSQPVVGVTWYEAVAYCAWLTATLDDGYVYRLPTEAEWERAARGNQGVRVQRYPWGDAWEEDRCNSQEAGLGVTSPVGIFPAGATPEGLQDMAGNVWEWCRDWYAEDYCARSGDARNPAGPEEGEYRVLRGGSWYDQGPHYCRCGSRDWHHPRFRGIHWGFRCARTSPQ